MSNQEAPFSYTTKVGSDLLTVRGGSYEEFLANALSLSFVPAIKSLLDILDGNTAPETTEQAVANVQAAFGQTAPSFAPVAPPTVAPVAVSANDRTCKHGTMLRRTGTSAKGEWRAFFCPTPKDTPDQCTAIFAKRGTPEWNTF